MPGEVVTVFLLQLDVLPIMPGDDAATTLGAAPAGHWLRVLVDRGIVERQLFARGDVPHGDENDLPLDSDVALAGVIQEHHHHLELAIRLTEKQRELFEDREHGGFFSSAAGDGSLVLRVKEDYDGAEPSGNSITALNLLRLAQITGRAEFRESAERLIAAFRSRLSAAPMAVPQMLVAYEFLLSEPRQIVIAGGRGAPDTSALLETVFREFVPNRVLLLVDSAETQHGEGRALAAPGLAAMHPLDGRAAAYVCRNYACRLPVCDTGELAKLLQ